MSNRRKSILLVLSFSFLTLGWLVNTAQADTKHFHPKDKLPSKFTIETDIDFYDTEVVLFGVSALRRF
jgi:hypothetical protein